MVKHIVMFQLTEEAKLLGRDVVVEKLRNSITNMNGKIPGLRKAELWDNNIMGSHDVALYCEFDTPEDIPFFQNHELHLAHKEMAKNLVCNRVFIDYKE